jgi:hypothetical protein
MRRFKESAARGSFLVMVLCAGIAAAFSARDADIRGTITSTLIIMENSRLGSDVQCLVNGAPCISFGAPGLTLDLNGYSITGLADVQATCIGGPTMFVPTAAEDGIELMSQANAAIRGPGVVRLFRGPGIFSLNGSNLTVTGVTVSNNCMSGILIGGGSNHDVEGNTAIRNGSRTFACGGI